MSFIGLDYSCFLSGLAAFALAAIAGLLSQQSMPSGDWQRLRIDWRWLSFGGVGLGIAEGLSLLALKINAAPALWQFSLLVQATAWCAVLEFGRRGFQFAGPKGLMHLPIWMHGPLVALAMLGAAIDGIEGLHLSVAIALGLPATVLTGLALLQAGTSNHAALRPLGIYVLSAGLLIVAIANAFGGYPICAVAMVVCVVGAWLTYQQNEPAEQRLGLLKSCLYPVGFVVLAVAGWVVLEGRGESDMLQPRLFLAQTTAGAAKKIDGIKIVALDKPLVIEQGASKIWRQSIPVLVIVFMVFGFWGLSKLPCVH